LQKHLNHQNELLTLSSNTILSINFIMLLSIFKIAGAGDSLGALFLRFGAHQQAAQHCQEDTATTCAIPRASTHEGRVLQNLKEVLGLEASRNEMARGWSSTPQPSERDAQTKSNPSGMWDYDEIANDCEC